MKNHTILAVDDDKTNLQIVRDVLEKDYDLAAHIRGAEMQPGDVEITFADTRKLMEAFGYAPETDLRTGLRRFVRWYAGYITDTAE